MVTVISLFDGAAALLEDGGEGGQGSGFVLDGEGYIATNAHVVTTGDRERRKRAKEVFVEFFDGNRVPAEVVGTTRYADVALIKVDPKGLVAHAARARLLGHLERGRARGRDRQPVRRAAVADSRRDLGPQPQHRVADRLQHRQRHPDRRRDQPRNSGGPLLNASGKVLGINSQIKSASGGGEGVGFAVPVDTVRRSLRELREDGEVSYGYLGVSSSAALPAAGRAARPARATTARVVIEVVRGQPGGRGRNRDR